MITLNQLTHHNRIKPNLIKRNKSLNKNPQKRGICQKIFTINPKKPNSAIRKVAKIKLTTKKIIIAYIPGEKHFLQEHQFVLIKGGRTKDLPGVNYKIIRGTLDAIGVLNRRTSRSKYGTKLLKKV